MVKILGHRGARGLWAENTLAGFRNAVALGVEMVEFDVHLSSDGAPSSCTTRCSTGPAMAPARSASARSPNSSASNCATATRPFRRSTRCSISRRDVGGAGDRDQDQHRLRALRGIESLILPASKARAIGRAIILSFVVDCLERVRALVRRGAAGVPVAAAGGFQGGLAKALDRLAGIPGAIAAVQEELFTLNEALCFSRMPAERLAVGINNVPARIEYWLGRPVRHLSTDRPDIALAMRDEGKSASLY